MHLQPICICVCVGGGYGLKQEMKYWPTNMFSIRSVKGNYDMKAMCVFKWPF